MPSEETHWVGVNVPVAVYAQLIAAFHAAGLQEGYGSIEDLLAEAVQKEIHRLQRSYNHGFPWGDEPVG